MSRTSTAVVVILALLTLSGLAIVSNLMGVRQSGGDARPSAGASAPALGSRTASKPSLALSPLPLYKPGQAEGEAQADLARAQSLLDSLAVAAAAQDWAQAEGLLAEFKQKTRRLPAPQLHHPDISPVLQDFFALYDVQLERAIAEQDAKRAAFALNQLYGIVGEQRARFGPRGLPLEFQRLRFLLREVTLWAEAGDEQMLGVRSAALRDAWSRDVRPIIASQWPPIG